MTDQPPTRRERWAAADAAEAERSQHGAAWGMTYEPDDRQPVELAGAAHRRGDRWFQIDLPIAYVQGQAHMGATSTRTHRADTGDVIGSIEAQGWQLEHVATAFVERGHASTKRAQFVVATSADDVANHGELVALYVFRRAPGT